MKYKVTQFEILAIVLAILLNSYFAFYNVNLLLEVIANSSLKYLIAVLPYIMFSLEIFVFLVYFYLYIKYKNETRHLVQINQNVFIIIAVLASLGISFGFIATYFSYDGNYINNQISYYYPLLFIIFHFIFLIVALYEVIQGNIILKKTKDMEDFSTNTNIKKHFSIKRFLFLIAFFIYLFFALSRFGIIMNIAELFDSRTFLMLLPIYLTMFIPLSLISLFVVYKNMQDTHQKRKLQFITSIVSLSYGTFSLIYFILMLKFTNTKMVEATANMFALDRLITFPMVFILLYVSILIPAIYSLINWFIYRINNNDN